MRRFILICSLALPGAAPLPAMADFFFEGLQPFSYRACIEIPAYSEPQVAIPRGSASVEGTPSAFNDGGAARFQAFPCIDRRGQVKYGPSRSHGAPRAPHQK